MLRKEAERTAGAGEFWWGLSAALGGHVEAKANRNRGTLPALFSKSSSGNKTAPVRIWIWDRWRSVLSPKVHGRIPNHVIVTGGHTPNPKNRRGDNHYALICRSTNKLALGRQGLCDLSQCQTVPNGKILKYVVGARLLEKSQRPLLTQHGVASPNRRCIAFEADLVGHCYVKLEEFRPLSQVELDKLRQYKSGDDWLALVKGLRGKN